jgi:hypothetical protein
MINKQLILKNAPSNMGQQIHVNHDGCSAGVDTKRRLYIKRSDRGLVAYCHHCNESGHISDGLSQGRLSTWISKKEDTGSVKSPAKPQLTKLSIEGEVWLRTNYCNTEDDNFHGIEGERHKVALTLHNPEQQPIGWQVRNLKAEPKYITYYTNNNAKGESSWFYKGNKTLVITEDYLSAYRVHKNTGLSSVALLRTNLSDRTLAQIYELGIETIFIWLDPDEAGMEGTTKLYKKLTHYLPYNINVALFGIDKEPKECTPAELVSILI